MFKGKNYFAFTMQWLSLIVITVIWFVTLKNISVFAFLLSLMTTWSRAIERVPSSVVSHYDNH